MPQHKYLSTYGRHRQRKVSVLNWFDCFDNNNSDNLSTIDDQSNSSISTSAHAMCLRKRGQTKPAMTEDFSDRNPFFSGDPDSFTEEIYGSWDQENVESVDGQQGKKTKTRQPKKKAKNCDDINREKKEKKPLRTQNAGGRQNQMTTKAGKKHRKQNTAVCSYTSDTSEKMKCREVNFSDIEKYSLIISESPPIENYLHQVVVTPGNRTKRDDDDLHLQEINPIPVYCSTPHLSNVPIKELEKPNLLTTESIRNVSFISNSLSQGHLSASEYSWNSCNFQKDFRLNGRESLAYSNHHLQNTSHCHLSVSMSLFNDRSPSSLAIQNQEFAIHQDIDPASASGFQDEGMEEEIRQTKNASYGNNFSQVDLFGNSDVSNSPLVSHCGSSVLELIESQATDYERDGEEDDENDEEASEVISILSEIMEEVEEPDDDEEVEEPDDDEEVEELYDDKEVEEPYDDEEVEEGYGELQKKQDLDVEEMSISLQASRIQLSCSSSFNTNMSTDSDQLGYIQIPREGHTPELIQRTPNLKISVQVELQRTPNLKMPISLQVELQKSACLMKQMLTPMRVPRLGRLVTFSEKVLLQCQQTEPLSFASVFPPKRRKGCVKIGEGVYGEVFRVQENGEYVALKIIPIEGLQLVNEEKQKTFEEILPEIVITKALSSLRDSHEYRTENFVYVKSVSVVMGCYPKALIDEWDKYASTVGSENDRPDMFGEEQLFVIFAFEDSGTNLENFELSNLDELKSIISQVSMSLATAEKSIEFEHRDLHWGNVLIKPTTNESIAYIMDGEMKYMTTFGIKVTIIDFTLSRLCQDECIVFTDLSTDQTLFAGKGDYQFDIYRLMKNETKNDWKPYHPYTNVLWIHYLMDKLVNAKFDKACMNRQLMHDPKMFLRSIKKYRSAADLCTNSSYFSLK